MQRHTNCPAMGPASSKLADRLASRPAHVRPSADVQSLGDVMSMARSVTFVLLLCFITLPPLHGQQASGTANRIHLTFNTDEAEAVLAILDKRAAGTAVTDYDWQHLFSTEPYVRLKKREASLHRDFIDDDFIKFVLSPELAAKNV